jgi:hypothetical protein
MDIVATDPPGGSRVLADVVVADPTQSPVEAVEPGHTARLVAEMKVKKHGRHFPNDTFVPFADNTYGCLDSAFDGLRGTCTVRAAEIRAGGLESVPLASSLICYNRYRISISLQDSQARSIHHRVARALSAEFKRSSCAVDSRWFCSKRQICTL